MLFLVSLVPVVIILSGRETGSEREREREGEGGIEKGSGKRLERR